jgi:D-alanine-D-alanine ligase
VARDDECRGGFCVARRAVGGAGGRENAEHDVSLATATAVAEALRSSGFGVDEPGF